MTTVTTTIADVLASVHRPGAFYATGTLDIHLPRLEVAGVGRIALPLLPVQAEQLIALADPAPYGRGSETLLDTSVRRTWQLDAARVSIGGRRWEQALREIVTRVTRDLGVAGAVEAQLYKLLVYDTGSFFITHRDTEKAPGMFATLVVVLPCDFSGGELMVRHRDAEVRLDLQRDEPSEVAYAAFYADCRHEVLPVASGYRLALTYNLVRLGSGALPEPPDYAPEQRRLATTLAAWGQDSQGAAKLVYPLEHAYTQAELGFARLKGADAAVAAVLLDAAREADCDLHLALVSIEESGWAEYVGGGWGNEAYEIGEVTEERRVIHDWRSPDGVASDMGSLPFDEAEVSPPEAFADLDDVDPEFQEATGNEGASFERFYQRAALVLWPRARRGRVLAEGGLDLSLPMLERLVAEWEAAGSAPDDPRRAEALDLAVGIRDLWPSDAWTRRHASDAGQGAGLLGALRRLGDARGSATFIAERCARGAYGPADNPAIAEALTRLPADEADQLLEALVRHNGPLWPTACAELLARCSEQMEAPGARLPPTGKALIEALPKEPPAAWRVDGVRVDSPKPELVVYALTALQRIDAALAGEALTKMLAHPQVYPVDDLLLPAALLLRAAVSGEEPAVFAALRQRVLGHLERRIAEPLEPPADWRRAADISCGCSHCQMVNTFLASPTESVWRLKAAQAQRDHLAHTVRRSDCDLDLATDKRGRPYSLVCTKNRASYKRRARQREEDLAHREALR
ncbi:2OG-Fe(II) oxygenase [Thiorhodococcus minor]|uniref:2OG-Fe(II) oxygenase n=1 Tax=Thiorhodococcus minor TaxID=57489 RepID=A0A6M0K4N0_9GAMM|nr:2OG-Fe(II) oxygenase [Thiorhodococcus minor]